MKQVFFALTLSALVTACAGSPIAPSPKPEPQPVQVTQPDPAPAPQPAPEPQPVPAPQPAPVPAPAPQPKTLVATVSFQYFYPGNDPLPATFNVTITDGQMSFGPFALPVVFADASNVIGKSRTMTVSITGNRWTLTAEAGEAFGDIR